MSGSCLVLSETTYADVKKDGLHEMQVLQVSIDGKEAFYSNKLPYMKSKALATQDDAALSLGFEVAKLSTLCVRKIELTEHAQNITIAHSISEEATAASEVTCKGTTFESFVCSFGEDVKNELIDMDTFIKSLKTLKLKCTVDKNGDKLIYISSDFGISYIIRRLFPTKSKHDKAVSTKLITPVNAK